MIILIFITTIIAILLSREASNKSVGIYAGFVMMILLVSGNHTNLDWENYEAGYKYKLDGHPTEWLYYLLRLWSNDILGLSYYWFRLWLTFFAFIILYFSVRRYIDNKNKYFCDFLILFILFPFFWEIPVHRNFVGFTIFMFSVRFLEEVSIKNLLYYLGFLILAGGIQSSFLLCVFFLLVFTLQKDNLLSRIVKIGILLFFSITFFPDSFLSPVQKFMIHFGDDRLKYVEEVQTRYGYLLSIFKQFIVFCTAWYGYFIVNKHGNISDRDYKYKLIKTIYLLTFIAFIFCPLYRLQGNFTRMINNIVPLLYLEYACVMTLLYGSKKYELMTLLYGSKKYEFKKIYSSRYTMIIYILSIYFLILLIGSHWSDIFIPALKDNWIIDSTLP